MKLPNQRGSKKTGDGAERDSCSDSRPEERKVEKLRVRDPARRATTTASERQATLQRKSTRKKGNETSEERETRPKLEQMKDRLAAENPEETEDNYGRQGSPARKVSS